MKVAACLFARNEVTDITTWLAWYHILGFDTCIVYDDHSTDDTWQVVEAAAQAQDIRLFKSLGTYTPDHRKRQMDCYLQAIKEFRGEFDWIGFFDCDEYLRLMGGSSIKTFLARFPAEGSVSVNWCCYGSSGHVLKPDLPAPVAYTWHSNESEPINRHVKTILHTSSWRGQYIGPHCFDVPPETAVDPAGEPIRWSIPGITQAPASWTIAKVMHYQCRSMEHFIERLKRVEKLPRTMSYWNEINMNIIEDNIPASLQENLKQQMALYDVPLVLPSKAGAPAPNKPYRHAEQRRSLVIDIGAADGNDSAFYLAKGFRVIAVEADPRACDTLKNRFRTQVNNGQIKILNFAVGAALGEKIRIFVHTKHQGISGISKRPDVPDDYLSFDVATIDWKTLLAQEGVPRYLKIDVEGSEASFMESMLTSPHIPEFISAECYSFAPIEMLMRMGYTRFKLVDQNPAGGFRLPDRQFEGDPITWNDFVHSSGPFGFDVFQDGVWLSPAEIEAEWQKVRLTFNRTWFDCHAWKPT